MTTPADRLQRSVDDLAGELREMRAALAQVDARLTSAVRSRRLAVVSGVIAIIVLAGVSTSNGRAISANNRLLCPFISIVASTDPPRETPAGIRMAEEASKLKRSAAYDCPDE